MEETPEGRIAHQAFRIIRIIQDKYPLRDMLGNLLHASQVDLEHGIRSEVERELDRARHEALMIPFAKQEAERRRIAAKLSNPHAYD